MDSNALEVNCQLVSRAIAGMIRRSIREEGFREKCFTLLQVTNSNDAELELQRKLRQCALRHRHSETISPNLQDGSASVVPLPEISNANPVTNTDTNDSHVVNKPTNKENVPIINSSSSSVQKTSVQHEGNFLAEHYITKDLSELGSSLEWDSTSTQSCSPQELLQQDANALKSDTNSTYNQKSNWFQPDSQEFEW